jgi:hypothetical protein
MRYDTDTLEKLGSRHACPTLNFRLREYVDGYKISKESRNYRGLLKTLRTHVAVRSVDSIIAISTLTEIDDSRIVDDVIRTLGNFYHESSISNLLAIYCVSETRDVRKAILDTILHLKTKCPEAKAAVLSTLSRDCKYVDELRVFYHRTW